MAAAPAHASQLHVDAINDAHEARALVDCLINRRDADGAFVVWEWLSRSGLLADDDALVRLLMTTLRLCANKQLSVHLEVVLAALPSATLKQQVTESLLNDTNLSVRLGPGIAPLLTANRGHPIVKAAALAILDTEDFARVRPSQVVSHTLNILGREAAGRKAAEAILDTKDFAKALPTDIVSHALNILGKEEAGLKAAQAILDTDNFATGLPVAVVSHALKILADEVTG